MKRILFAALFLFVASVGALQPTPISLLQIPTEKVESIAGRALTGALSLTAGSAFLSVSLLSRLGWAASLVSPWSATVGSELLVLSQLTESAAKYAFSQFGNETSFLSTAAWERNKQILSQIPAKTRQEKELLLFLERRFLAKCAGYYPILVNQICPLFGIAVQAHPETQSTYARDPRRTMLETYKYRMEDWKKHLPHPHSYPLLLTRPASLQEYFPSYFTIANVEEVSDLLKNPGVIVVDLSHLLKGAHNWLETWKTLQKQIPQHPRLLYVEKVRQGSIGGIRLLPFEKQSAKEIEKNYRYLLEWISFFGLTANRIELDRLTFDLPQVAEKSLAVSFQSKEHVLSAIATFREKWASTHPQKNLMVEGTLHVLTGLLREITEQNWNEIMGCETRALIAQVSFEKIQQQLTALLEETEDVRFFDTAEKVEQVHAELMTLLEIFSPFTATDFPAIYQHLLTSIPDPLRSLTSHSIHASGMTSMAGILKAVEKQNGALPHILFGENTYYECIMIGDHVTHCTPVEEATDEDWRQVDLLLVQFNPALKRTHLEPTSYKVEPIADMVQKTLALRNCRPLTVAFDCTIDYIDSFRIGKFLSVFQKEIEAGILNIACYRSGLKFDLFGMDNYCGAPFYMIHNNAPHWQPFDALLTDPALVTDPLSINWFCLAYKNAAPYLERYRQYIFDNTRTLLRKIPSRLFEETSPYRVVAVDEETDLCFIDMKITGPMHILRGSTLAGGLLYLKSMEKGFPIFYRRSIGFYHSNFAMLFCDANATIRLTLGIDSDEVDLFAETFAIIDTLNGSSPQTVLKKI